MERVTPPVNRAHPAHASADLPREVEALMRQWPRDMQQSFLTLARYLTSVLPPPGATASRTAGDLTGVLRALTAARPDDQAQQTGT